MDGDLFHQRLSSRLQRLYGDRAESCLQRIDRLIERYAGNLPASKSGWDERDVWLITYGDMVRRPSQTPLRCLGTWLAEEGLQDLLGTIHLLPFFPYSSDDGFSVIDYRRVDPDLGDWNDVAALADRYELMFDLVLNHVSAESAWFRGYRAGEVPWTRFFIEADPADERLRQVVRPRSLPLLTEVATTRGRRHVWSTFSADQIDLNFAEPDVLLEMLDVLLGYLARGARAIRLDAIAYLWKRLGTPCIHLPETHEVVRLMRDVVERVAPGTILLTETNVPHEENFSYFGKGDEARMVYQFSLAPLLLEALLSGDATLLRRWLSELEPPPAGCTVLNFTASHDGVGVRPLEGLMPEDRQRRLVRAVRDRGGRVSTKRNADGSDSPYELNITYFSALGPPTDRPWPTSTAGNPHADDTELHVRRFLASQAIMLSLQGIPGIYFHSLVGTPNDYAAVERTGHARAINRRKFDHDELQRILAAAEAAPRRVLEGYRRLLAARIGQPAFHPDGAQQVIPAADPALLTWLRVSPDGGQRMLVAANCGPRPCRFDTASAGLQPRGDLLSPITPVDPLELDPYQVAWLPLVQ